MKKLLSLTLSLALLALLLLPGSTALAAKEVTELSVAETEDGLHYAFRCPGTPYLLLWYKTADESGKLVLTGSDGLFEGDVRLAFRQKAGQVKLEIKRPSGQTLETVNQPLRLGQKPAERKAEKGAAGKISDLSLSAEGRKVIFRCAAPGHHQLLINVSSVLQKAEYLLDEATDGVFTDELMMTCANAKDLVTVTVKTPKGKQLAKEQIRLPFVAPEAGETAADGLLKGIKVCIDPGHQELGVPWGRVYQYPGSTKLVSGGDSTMAQGKVTLRKESVCVLEISYHLCRVLRELGAEVVMTRWVEETSVTNMERAEYANNEHADYCFRIHLNLEEKNLFDAIRQYSPYNIHVHLSDNNRRYPGQCGLDFEKIISLFKECGYDGFYTTEIFQLPSMEEAAKGAAEYLIPIMKKVYGE